MSCLLARLTLVGNYGWVKLVLGKKVARYKRLLAGGLKFAIITVREKVQGGTFL